MVARRRPEVGARMMREAWFVAALAGEPGAEDLLPGASRWPDPRRGGAVLLVRSYVRP